MSDNLRADFILIPGEEVSGPKIVHTTAMNISGLVVQDQTLEIKSEILLDHVHKTMAAGGHTILNHPNYHYTITAEDILPVGKLHLFELFNGHPRVNNFGDDTHPSTEELWDVLLRKGKLIYGVSSDDAHHFASIDTHYSNPGRGWVMVSAPELTAAAITLAMNRGDFYASNGVILSRCCAARAIYSVEIDLKKTDAELASPELRGKRVIDGKEEFVIEFIGPERTVKSCTNFTKADFTITDSQSYIRPKVTWRRKHPEGGLEEFYAWGQPVFSDGRANQ
jgi:hypothetical protein